MMIDPALLVAAGGFLSAIAAVYVSIRNAHSSARKDELETLRGQLASQAASAQEQIDQLDKDLQETRRKLEEEIREKRLLMRRVAILEAILLKHNIELPPEEGIAK